ELLTQPYQDFTIESFLQDLVSSKQFSVEWAALIHQNKDRFIVSKLVNKKDNSNDNKEMKANSIFELTEILLEEEETTDRKKYQDAAEHITKGSVDYLPSGRSALSSYSLQDTAGIGVHGQGLDNDIIQNIAENVNNLPIIQKNLNFLKLYGKNMKYFQPIYIK